MEDVGVSRVKDVHWRSEVLAPSVLLVLLAVLEHLGKVLP